MTANTHRPVALALGGLLALAVSQGIGRFVYTPILPAMVEELGLSRAQAGFIASANFLGYLAGALCAAAPFLGGRARLTLLGALALSAATTAAMGGVSSFAAFAGLRFLGGLASAFVLVFSSALVLERLQASGRSDLSAVHFSGVGVGIAVSAALVAALGHAGAAWSTLWIASGLVSLLAGLAVLGLVPDEPAAAAILSARTISGPKHSLSRFTVAYGLFGFGYVITATFLVAIVRGSADLRPLEPVVWIIVGLTGAPSVALWSWLGRVIGLPRAFALACGLEAAGVLLSISEGGPAALILGAALLGGTFMGISALGLVAGRRLSPGDPRRTLALMTSAFGLGQIVGPGFAGVTFDLTGSFVLPSLAAAAALVVAALLTYPARMEP